MEIFQIKQKTKETLKTCRSTVVTSTSPIMLITIMLSLVILFLSLFYDLFLLLFVALIPLYHGYINIITKAVRNGVDNVSVIDGFSGFKNYTKIFTTYFIKTCLILSFMAILTAVVYFMYNIMAMYLILNGFVDSVLLELSYGGYVSGNTLIFIYGVLAVILFFIILLFISFAWINAKYCFTYFLHAKVNFKDKKVMTTSRSITKEYIGYLFIEHVKSYLIVAFTGLLFFVILTPFVGTNALLLIVLSALFTLFTIHYVVLINLNIKIAVLFDVMTSKNIDLIKGE